VWPSGFKDGFERDVQLEDGEVIVVRVRQSEGWLGWSVHVGDSGTFRTNEQDAWKAARSLARGIERDRREKRCE
jgi:hypothetical protein